MNDIYKLIASVGPLDHQAIAQAHERQLQLTKPPASLGRLEELAIQIAGITGRVRPELRRSAVVIMAADHGVTMEGVSAYPAEVTLQMVKNFLNSGAAINALARQSDTEVIVVDVGVAASLKHPLLRSLKVRSGTANMLREPAMNREEALQAIQAGIDVVHDLVDRGFDLIATGEMGIGNTTAASAVTAALLRLLPQLVTGHGTGIDEQQRQHKVEVITQALEKHQPDPRDPIDVLSKVGGLEIAGLVGVIIAAAARRVPIILDGFITSTAACLAYHLCPSVRDFLIAGHVSVERGHRVILEHLKLLPLLNLNLRLGEGTGAVLAIHIVKGALCTHNEMVTFAEAGVSNRTIS